MNVLIGRSRGRGGFFALDDRGATAVEYSIMAALIAAVIVFAVTAFGTSVKELFKVVLSAAPFN